MILVNFFGFMLYFFNSFFIVGIRCIEWFFVKFVMIFLIMFFFLIRDIFIM